MKLTQTLSVTATVICLAAPAFAWVQSATERGAPISWPKRDIKYQLNESGSEDVELDKVEEAIIDSYSTWNGVDCSDLTLTYDGITSSDAVGYSSGGDNHNIVVWQETQSDWIHADGVIAVTTVTFCTETRGACAYNGAILDADIEMNGGEFRFTTNARIRSLFDISNTVTHEVGHMLGLDHTGVAAATMYASAPPGETSKRSLHSDDRKGLCHIYPSGEPTSFWPDDESSLTEDCSASPGSTPGQGAWWAAALALVLLWRRRRS